MMNDEDIVALYWKRDEEAIKQTKLKYEAYLMKIAKNMLKDYQEDLEKNTYWRRALYMYYMYGINNIRDYKPAVEAITAETVQATLKELLKAGNMYEVVMFPEN